MQTLTGLYPMVQRQECRYHARGPYKDGCLLPRRGHRLCKAWLYTTQFGEPSAPPINRLEILRLWEQDQDLDDVRSNTVRGASIVFTRYAKAGVTRIRDSDNICTSVEGIDASQLYPYAMCQEMPTGIYTGYEWDPETEYFKPKTPTHHYFEEKVLKFYQQRHATCGRLITLANCGYQRRVGRYFVDGYCAT